MDIEEEIRQQARDAFDDSSGYKDKKYFQSIPDSATTSRSLKDMSGLPVYTMTD